ncbi:MAG: sulfotransferase domain-containing protein [Nitrososphaerales archaeon]
MNKTILVLGMRRSGTSLTTNLIQEMGAFVDNDRRDPDAFNVRGYWEGKELHKLDRRIQKRLGGIHDRIPWAPSGWELDPKFEALRAEGIELISRYDKEYPVWCWKDPRLSFVLPFWNQILKREAYHIICVRNPLEVADSWVKMDHQINPEITLRFATESWFANTVSAVRNTSDKKRMLVFYEDIISDPVSQTKTIASFVGLAPPENARIASVVSSDLRHRRYSTEEMLNHPEVDERVKLLYCLLLQGKHDQSTLSWLGMIFRNYAGSHPPVVHWYTRYLQEVRRQISLFRNRERSVKD